jgi:transposase
MKLKRIAIDTSKSVFTLHGIDETGNAVLRRELRRGQVETFFAKQKADEVVLEACGAAHHWGRRLGALGHTVKLVPPQYVKPFVKRGKNDRIDAEAISEAAARPSMRFVPVKGAEEQAAASVLKVRELLVRQRTQTINALRGHAAEFGIVAAKGRGKLAELAERVAAADMPQAAKAMLGLLGEEVDRLDKRIGELDRKIEAMHRDSATSQLLAEIPGIGSIAALTATLTIDAKQFKSGRHLAAWIGLIPREHSTGGKHRLGAISKQGNERMRQLLVLGATAVLKAIRKPGHRWATTWLVKLTARKPFRVAAVALANKIARIIWAMMTGGEVYRQPAARQAAAAA